MTGFPFPFFGAWSSGADVLVYLLVLHCDLI